MSAYYQANKVAVHTIGDDGAISDVPIQSIPTAEKAHGIAIDSTNSIAFVSHTGANRVYQFRFDARSGRLSLNDTPFADTPPGDQPRHIALHPSDRWAYTSNEAGDSIGVFSVDANAGTLERMQTLSTLPENFDGSRNSTRALRDDSRRQVCLRGESRTRQYRRLRD